MLKFQIIIIFSILIFPIKCQILNGDSDSVKSVAKAMTDVIHKFYITNKIKFDLIIFGNTTNHINDLINEVSKEINDKTVIKCKHIERIRLEDLQFMESGIVFIESEKGLLFLHTILLEYCKIYRSLPNWSFDKMKFLIYVEKIKSVGKLLEIMNKFNINRFDHSTDLRAFEFFLTNEENFVTLSTNVLYSEDECKNYHVKDLNRFEKSAQMWLIDLENFDHFSNFYECVLTFQASYSWGPFWYTENYEENNCILKIKNSQVRGINHLIIELAAKKFNFLFNYTVFVDKSDDNYQEQKKHIHFTMGDVDYESGVSRWSEPCGSTDFYYLVTENEFYTNYEKVLMPFDLTTWILLFVTISLTFVIIFGTYGLPQ
ncbi:hypothetical protein PVAND_014538 [Polypedilum vanderplanki]|uniref:Uncharacterized protein n=1 Tax=Polypedilum vanderplanki TaxID=319348 RepID=A0A9J6BA03_POLVA|nr:hypothetical protein PVAND_014538 [Polypedilum vanderplanki]